MSMKIDLQHRSIYCDKCGRFISTEKILVEYREGIDLFDKEIRLSDIQIDVFKRGEAGLRRYNYALIHLCSECEKEMLKQLHEHLISFGFRELIT